MNKKGKKITAALTNPQIMPYIYCSDQVTFVTKVLKTYNFMPKAKLKNITRYCSQTNAIDCILKFLIS